MSTNKIPLTFSRFTIHFHLCCIVWCNVLVFSLRHQLIHVIMAHKRKIKQFINNGTTSWSMIASLLEGMIYEYPIFVILSLRKEMKNFFITHFFMIIFQSIFSADETFRETLPFLVYNLSTTETCSPKFMRLEKLYAII